jgi:hypothetical protein
MFLSKTIESSTFEKIAQKRAGALNPITGGGGGVSCCITIKFPRAYIKVISKVVLIRLGIYVFVNKARGGGSPKFFINTL